jgi:hypothetical protein
LFEKQLLAGALGPRVPQYARGWRSLSGRTNLVGLASARVPLRFGNVCLCAGSAPSAMRQGTPFTVFPAFPILTPYRSAIPNHYSFRQQWQAIRQKHTFCSFLMHPTSTPLGLSSPKLGLPAVPVYVPRSRMRFCDSAVLNSPASASHASRLLTRLPDLRGMHPSRQRYPMLSVSLLSPCVHRAPGLRFCPAFCGCFFLLTPR